MSNILPFNFGDELVRVVLLADDPWWVATDIAAVLGYVQAKDMTRFLDDDEKGRHNVPTLGGVQELTIISESGVFAAVLKSRRPEAKAFRKWVTGTVLPELRRTGTYSMAPEQPALIAPLADVDTTRFSLALSAVSLMRKMRGNSAALMLWDELGLPRPDLTIEAGSDDMAQRVMMWATDRDNFTMDELAAGLGLSRPDNHLRQRIGDMLRMMGFDRKRMRRGGRHGDLIWGWYRPAMEMAA